MIRKIPFAYRITIIYVLLGIIWILYSDRLVINIANNTHQIQIMSTYKGWLYVLITGLLLFIFIRNEIRKKNLLYDQLLEAKKKSEESDKLKTAFLSNLSHYIRTPMNGILGFVELLDDKDTTPENHQLFIRYINEHSHNLLQTLNNIVDISKIQQGLTKVEFKNFKINSMIDEIVTVTLLDISHKNKPITIKKSYGLTNENDELYSDRDKIRQVLTFLFDNALHFTVKGEIEIGYTTDNMYINFFVKDTGPGISLEKQKSLFTDFMSNATFTVIEGEGAGLGLYISSGLVKLLDGKIWLEKTSPEGSLICFSVPGKVKTPSPHSDVRVN